MMWVRYGQQVEFKAEAYPGESFKGKISFIDPVLDPRTRTVKLRVNVENPDGRLKPGMFVRAIVRAEVAQAGQVMDPAMAGKWVCPMHPDIVKDVSGSCDICEMPLVTTESLGYVKVNAPNEAPLVIPASAPLITGTRAVVYVKVTQTEKPTYEGREVVLGPRAGDHYIVDSGLSEGEVVVTRGSFKIDSAMQIQAKPSMMSPLTGQTICPIMGGPINKDVFVEYRGKKVYFCCPGCEPQFKKNPDKYMDKLPQFKEQ
ncbi:MAG: efflux RND transporter periplasmic adaptor subunit [Planctomycetota bacterium]|jgi:Cu(I)/Ag(I) efflux system membrane fusion protein